MITWMGGKYYIKDWIINHMPKHNIYAELFGGAGWVLWHKEPIKINVYNDKNALLSNLFYHFFFNKEEFLNKAKFLPPSDNLMRFFNQKLKDKNDIKNLTLDDAIMFAYVVCNSFSGYYKNKRYISFLSKSFNWRAFLKKLENIYYKGHLIIHNRDYKWIIDKYDSKDTLFYIDPPYLNMQWYDIKFDLDEHKKLANILNNIKGKAIISYYPDDRLYKWYPEDKWFYDYKIVTIYSEKKINKAKQKKVEMLIMNYNFKEDNFKTKNTLF